MRERQLRAILFSDIVGFSRQMAADETLTLAALKRNRDSHQRLVSQYNGRIVDRIGDGHLCLFASSLEAVNCGLALQRDLASRQDNTQLRVGVHVGDTLVETWGLGVRSVVGDCVNIASRIESNAPGPGVWVSARVASDLHNHAAYQLDSAGMFDLKNIAEPMEIVQVTNDAPHDAPVANPSPALFRRRKPGRGTVLVSLLAVLLLGAASLLLVEWDDPETLVILPLEYIGADADYAYLAQASTERLQSSLSDLEHFKLVSQVSARRLGGIQTPLDQEEIDFFLEGSVVLNLRQITLGVRLIEADTEALYYSGEWQADLEGVKAMEDQAIAEIIEYLSSDPN